MARTIVGLDIGRTSIKLIRLEVSLLRFEFLDFSEHPLPAHVDLPWEQLVRNVLQVLFLDRELKADKVIASIPGHQVSARVVSLPFSDRKKLDQVLPFEIEGMIPLPLEEILLDYEILEAEPEGARVLTLCTEKKVLASHLELLREAGIDPHTVLPVSIALSNLWKEISNGDDDPYAIVDVGEGETSLCVIHGRRIRYGRAWAFGSSMLTRAIQEGLGLAPNLARERKEREADLYPKPTPGGDSEPEWMANILRKAIGPVIGGIRQSLLSVSRSLDLTVRRLYLCGRGSRLRGLDRFLAEELQIEVKPLVLHGPVGSLLASGNHDPAAAAPSLGLAYHAVRDMAASRLNLRTGPYTYAPERKELKRQLVSAGIMAAIVLFLALASFALQIRYRSQEYDRLTATLDKMALEIFPELRNLPPGVQRVSAITSRLEREKRERNLFAPFSSDSPSVLDVLLEITKAVPRDVKIDVREILIEDDKVRIEAETDSYNAIEQIKQNLLSTGLFARADWEAKDALDPSKVKFKMLLELNQRLL